MMRRVIKIGIAALVLALCLALLWFRLRTSHPEMRERLAQEYTDSDGYAVLSAWKQGWSGGALIYVRKEVGRDPAIRDGFPSITCLPETHRAAYSEAMADFSSKWTHDWVLMDLFSPPHEFVIVPETELGTRVPLFTAKDKAAAKTAGYFAFSAPGFDRNRTRAVIYVVHKTGFYDWGEAFLMKKGPGGQWVIEGNGNCGWLT